MLIEKGPLTPAERIYELLFKATGPDFDAKKFNLAITASLTDWDMKVEADQSVASVLHQVVEQANEKYYSQILENTLRILQPYSAFDIVIAVALAQSASRLIADYRLDRLQQTLDIVAQYPNYKTSLAEGIGIAVNYVLTENVRKTEDAKGLQHIALLDLLAHYKNSPELYEAARKVAYKHNVYSAQLPEPAVDNVRHLVIMFREVSRWFRSSQLEPVIFLPFMYSGQSSAKIVEDWVKAANNATRPDLRLKDYSSELLGLLHEIFETSRDPRTRRAAYRTEREIIRVLPKHITSVMGYG